MLKTGSDFSGVGAFDQALKSLGIKQNKIFACDMDKYARETYIHNYGEPKYYPKNVYDREIPSEPLDIYMTSPPCQSFSLAGKRKGESDDRGVLFYNSHEFIVKNKPRFFIFENVKGLLSDAKGRTFQIWLDMLGGKSVNGNPVIFPREDATPYHIYHKVLNAKHYGVPQNRERVFIVGIRDDNDNTFTWEKPIPLTKRLKDVLESDVDSKYYLSDKLINTFITRPHAENYPFAPMEEDADRVSPCLTARYLKMSSTDPYIKVKSATKKGYETATENDSINLSVPNSETRRGRVGKEVAQTLDTQCNQGVLIGAIRGRNPENPKSREVGLPTEQRLEVNDNGTANTLTTVQKDNVVVYKGVAVHPLSKKLEFNGFKDSNCPTLLATDYKAPKCVQFSDYKIRKLTPRECFRLMDFPDSFTWTVSNTQAYKQAGNSIVVAVLASILRKLPL